MSPIAAYESFGVEVSAPYLVIVALADAGLMPATGTMMEWDGMTYFQVSPPQAFAALGPASHCSAVFQLYQFAKEGG